MEIKLKHLGWVEHVDQQIQEVRTLCISMVGRHFGKQTAASKIKKVEQVCQNALL
jgi:hypothetical protein